MSNRLEQEFPNTSWRAVPPVGPRGLERDVVRRYVARGHELRSQAIRKALRDANAAVVRALIRVAAFVRCAAHGFTRRPPEHDCWPPPAHRA
jgi:hypothetical protein